MMAIDPRGLLFRRAMVLALGMVLVASPAFA